MSDIVERLLTTRDCTVCDGDGTKSNGRICGGCDGAGKVLRYDSVGKEAAAEIERLRSLATQHHQGGDVTDAMVDAACSAYSNGDPNDEVYPSGMRDALTAALAQQPLSVPAWITYDELREMFPDGIPMALMKVLAPEKSMELEIGEIRQIARALSAYQANQGGNAVHADINSAGDDWIQVTLSGPSVAGLTEKAIEAAIAHQPLFVQVTEAMVEAACIERYQRWALLPEDERNNACLKMRRWIGAALAAPTNGGSLL